MRPCRFCTHYLGDCPGELCLACCSRTEDDDEGEPSVGPPATPTSAAPGSEAKIDVLAARADAREDLFHPDDWRGDEESDTPCSGDVS